MTKAPALTSAPVALSTIRFDPKNARGHTEKNIKAIKDSLTDHGQVLPLLVRKANRQLIGGEGTVRAMLELGWTQADAVFLDISAKQARKLSLRLNRTAELAHWNFQTLITNFEEVGLDFDFSQLGWEPHEVDPLLKAWQPPAVESLPTGKKRKPPITLTEGQRQTVDRAIARCRKQSGQTTDGECLTLICEHYLDATKPSRAKR